MHIFKCNNTSAHKYYLINMIMHLSRHSLYVPVCVCVVIGNKYV